MEKDTLLWLAAYAKEIGHLVQGLEDVAEGTNIIHFIHPLDKPADRKAVYLRIVSAF